MMKINGRKKDILDIMYEKNRVSVTELSKTLYVSEMTIRRDLNELEQIGVLRRYRGGAVLTPVSCEMPVAQRFFVGESEKISLAKKASEYLRDNQSVYIDSSSTCQHIIPYISRFKGITVITNSVNALLMVSKLQIPCILIGGEYYSSDMCLVGSVAEDYAARFNADVAFFSSLGLSDDGIISDSDIRQTMVRKIVMRNSQKNIFLFERNKINKKFLYTLCHKDEVYRVITV